jgi:hypothetical protein
MTGVLAKFLLYGVLSRWWVYPSLSQVRAMFGGFSQVELRACGFLSPLGRNEFQGDCLAALDLLLNPFLPEQGKVICLAVR